MKKIIALILCLVMCVPLFAACGGDEPADTSASTTAAPTTTGGEGVTTDPVDNGPGYKDVVKKDWDEYTFKILYGNVGEENYPSDFICENPNGNILNDQVYARNTRVEADCNINLDPIYDSTISVSTMIQTQYTAGWTEGDYDMFGHSGRSLIPLAANGYLANLGEYEEINIYNDYWDQGFIDQFLIEDSIYALSGEISVNAQLNVQVMTFNKRLFSENGKELPYDAVRNYEWTVDLLLNYMEGFAKDIDNDGYDWDKDIFALSGWADEASYGVFYGSGFTFAKNDGETITLDFDSDFLDEVTDALLSVWTKNGSFIIRSSDAGALHHMPHEIFSTGRGLFCDITCSKIARFFAEMDDDYGILPEPMFNEEQGRYYTYTTASSPVVVVGVHDENPERTGNIIEALCAASSDFVMPKMLEIVTKIQNARDEDSADMLDIAFATKIFDAVHWLKFNLYYYPHDMIKEGQNVMASYLKMYENTARSSLEAYVEGIISLND